MASIELLQYLNDYTFRLSQLQKRVLARLTPTHKLFRGALQVE